MPSEALAYAQTHRAEAVKDLQALLQIPSVSTLSENVPDMHRTAAWLRDKLTAVGMENAAVLPTAGLPVVYAEWLHAGPDAPTVLIYGHYDVQPVDPLDEWDTPPFDAIIQGDDIIARGAADDKGQLFIHVMAVAAYLKTSGRLPLNVKFMLEGEEELGSTNLESFMRAHKDRLQADVALISDTPMLDPQTPIIVTGVRGLTYMEVSLRGSKMDLHSGAYGGVVQNPLNALTRMLASLHDADGRITIPGFYEDVADLSAAERDIINDVSDAEARFLKETGAPQLWNGEAGYTARERQSVRPTLDIHGIKGGFVGEGQKTVIPATASAKVSMRLVPNQGAHDIAARFTAHIKEICPPTMELTVETLATCPAAMVDITAPALEAAADAYEAGFGTRPLLVREGGSLPVVGMFADLLNLPVVLMGFGLPDDRIHAPNEKFHLPNFHRGIETAIHYYDILARQK